MTTLTEKFTTLEGQINDDADEAHSQRESIISTLEDIQSGLASINSDMLLMKSALLGAIGTNIPFCCDAPPSLIVPPTSPATHPVDADRCKRVQAFINAMHEITGVIGAATDSGVFWTPSVIINGINEVITTLVTGGTVPLPSLPEATNIAGDALNYALSNIGRGDDLQAQFDSISSGMTSGLYLAGSPSATQGLYASLVSSSGLPSDEKLLFGALGFNALFSYFFDPASTPDLTGYSGSACLGDLHAITTCVDIAASLLPNGPVNQYFLAAPPQTSDPYETAGDFFHFTFKVLTLDGTNGVAIVRRPSGGGARVLVATISEGATWTMLDHTSIIDIYSNNSGGSTPHAFTMRVCPP